MANSNRKLINLTGQVFGRLTVIKESVATYTLTAPDKIRKKRYRQRIRQWDCLCSCGSLFTIDQKSLVSNHTTSCGCLQREDVTQRMTTHGRSKTPTYNTWQGIRNRCNNPNDESYRNYGGRGIKVCDRWQDSFENFLEDMGERPSSKHSIDRIDVNGNYEPSNCRWATPEEQGNNKRNNQNITYQGETMSVAQWSRKLKIAESRLYSRFKRGLPVHLIFWPRSLTERGARLNALKQ